MLSEALRRFRTHAGAQFPALSRTLQHFLTVSLQPNVEKSELVGAIERDPAILISVLSASSASLPESSQWHLHFSLSMLQAMAIDGVVRPTQLDSPVPAPLDGWQRPLKRSLLAATLARKASICDPEEARLVALLSELCGWLPIDPQEDVSTNEERAAVFLESIGCTTIICDAVRYQSMPLDSLTGTYPVIQANAISRSLLDCVDSATVLDLELTQAIESLVTITPSRVDDVLQIAAHEYHRACQIIGSDLPTDTTALAADASTGAVFYRAMVGDMVGEDRASPLEDRMTQVARSLLGPLATCHFRPDASCLEADLDGSPVRIHQDARQSLVARCYRQQRILTSSKADLKLLVEQQLASWLGQRNIVWLPLGRQAGVLALAMADPDVTRQSVLLAALAQASADAYAHSLEQNATPPPTIEVDKVREEARQITHEVNNGLSITQNYLRALTARLGDESASLKEASIISDELKRIATIVQRYAGIGSPQTLVYRVMSLNRMIEEQVTLMKASAPTIAMEVRGDDSIPELELAEDAIKQVVLNVLKNAMEALSDTGSPTIVITTEGAVNVDGRPHLEIVISDNGPGMSQEERLGLFNSTSSAKGEGRGLGLTIARQLLDEMGGLISCRTNGRDAGTSFQILLPIGV